MSDNKKMVKEITSMDVDFAQWYTDIVKKADLAAYSNVKGFMIIRPYGFAMWELMQGALDKMFKDLGHENICMPMLIPESLLNKEKDHVEGFAPEVAWVTFGGSEKLEERFCIRPTSETLFCDHFKDVVQSWRDLPLLYNQWVSVVRWEKTTRPFLRTREFLWQEGHTLHATQEEAEKETIQMLETYAKFCKEYLAIPVVQGRKTDKEKFAGAEATYTIEALMHDGKALQSGTSHYFGDGFSRAFDVTFTDKDNKLAYPHQTSWGCTTRLIGAVIMTHGDDNGLVIPPMIAPTQVMIVPVAQHKAGVLEKAEEVMNELKSVCRVKMDASSNSPGWKFAEYEMKGVPLRLELGPRDIENGVCILSRRDTGEKITVDLEKLTETVPALLKEIQENMYQRALDRRIAMTHTARNLDQIKEIAATKPGFIRAMWCGDQACEVQLKDEAEISSRCMPFEDQEQVSDVCVCCGKPAKKLVYWGKAY
ncbi:MAG: proline--tRNA ligase [Clostridia bacterium]|nr:proline--tRNA ligase [Clostridia bacterium]